MKNFVKSLLLCAALLFTAQVALWAFDNKLPIQVGTVEPAFGQAGGLVHFTANVKRDLTRQCTLKISRRLWSPSGYYIDLKESSILTPHDIAGLQKRTPNQLKLSLAIPEGLTPGRYELVSSLSYTCNPWQYFFPIHGESILPFNILPPPSKAADVSNANG